MIVTRVTELVDKAVAAISVEKPSYRLEFSDPTFGDIATNVAMVLAKQVNKNPRDIAQQLTEKLVSDETGIIKEVSVAGPGFINIIVSDEFLSQAVETQLNKLPQLYENKTVVAEYSDPNTFKALHAGHLYTTIVGNSVANLIEKAGGLVHRVNFGGDVGLHVAKAMWGVITHFSADFDASVALEGVEKLAGNTELDRAKFLAECYVAGSAAYENDENKQTITDLNRRVYELHNRKDKESDFAQLYWLCRQWSYDYFDYFYEELGVTPFERYYPESSTFDLGIETINKNIGSVYERSDGAVVFRGERYKLHTRVFINSDGLPTYEAKDVGLIMHKWNDYKFDISLIITSSEQKDYMRVVLKSIEQFAPELAQKTRHLTHGHVKLKGGVKMSSRKGNVLLADDVLAAAVHEVEKDVSENRSNYAYDAVKYSFLNQSIGGDIVYDPSLSVALTGDSGPYIQYAHARAFGVLEKAGISTPLHFDPGFNFEEAERQVLIQLAQYSSVFGVAAKELTPHKICGFLHDTAQVFNRYYDANKVIGSGREAERLFIVQRFKDVVEHGLNILGIHAPNKM